MTLNISDIRGALEGTNLEDQTKDDFKGGLAYAKLPMGKSLVRLVEYIELGDHKQPDYQGTKKPDAPMVSMTFEFLSKRNIIQREDGKGEIAPRKTIWLKKSFNERAGYRKLFDKMRAGDSSITHMSQMLGGHHWFMNIDWVTQDATDSAKKIKLTRANADEYVKREEDNKDNKDFRVWDNMRNSDGFMISAASRDELDEDNEPTGNTIPMDCRPHIGPLKIFLWDDARPLFWASIFIDGSYTKKVGDKEEQVSKNRHQNQCMAASNYAGSSLELMLTGLGDLPNGETPPEEKPSEEKPMKKEDGPGKSEEDLIGDELGLG